MSRTYFLVLLFAALGLGAKAQVYNYDILYHCAFINENAAHATVCVYGDGDNYHATLNGHSRQIGETIFCINDTLQSSFSPSGPSAAPACESVQYISGYYRKPHAHQYADPNDAKAFRAIDGTGQLSASDATMECVSLTADMLCIFHYAKTVDFGNLPYGKPIEVPVTMPDGQQRTLQIAYNGVTDFNGRSAWHLTVNFTYGEALSQYPITVMVDTEWRIPLQFAATIDIGAVQMDYVF